MPGPDTIRIQAIDGKLWDIPKDKLPDAQKRGAKVYTAPVEQPAQPESAISRFGSGAKAGLQPLIPSNPFTVPALEKAAMGPTGMLLDAINRVRGEYGQARHEGQPPWAAALGGPAAVANIDTEGVRQRAAKGD